MAKVLVVEDDTFLRDLYIDVLKGDGFTVDTAIDGEEGIAKLQVGGYDLVLLDIMLPKLDGLSILRKLKDIPSSSPNKSIVVLSNLGQETAISEAISLGAKGYMIKSDYTPDQALKQFKSYMETISTAQPSSTP
jgi:DNA-binding response OmpR family regulator